MFSGGFEVIRCARRLRGAGGGHLRSGSPRNPSSFTAFLRRSFTLRRFDTRVIVVSQRFAIIAPGVQANAIQGIPEAFIGKKAIRGAVRLRGDPGLVAYWACCAPPLRFLSASPPNIASIRNHELEPDGRTVELAGDAACCYSLLPNVNRGGE
jgi:hypothetical protein